jgi:hypothetical protein
LAHHLTFLNGTGGSIWDIVVAGQDSVSAGELAANLILASAPNNPQIEFVV